MALRKFLFMSADGYSQEAAGSTDSLELGGLKMYGALDMNNNPVTAVQAADADGEALVYGQSGANLAGLSIDTAALTMGGQKITGLGTPTNVGDAATKDYVDLMVTAGGPVKEELFDYVQLSNTEGIFAGETIFFANQPAAGDTVIITDGTNTRTYTFVANIAGESAATDVSIETDAATAMQRLVTRMNADAGNTWWSGKYLTTHSDINAGVILVYEEATAAGKSTSRIYGTWTTQADFKVVEFQTGTTTLTILPYSTRTAASAITTDPGYGRFGMRREDTALTDGEMHLDLSSDNLYSWNGDASTWFQISGPGSIPLATSASGGGVIGRATFDQDKGLKVTTGIAEIQLKANYGLKFETTVGADKGALMLAIDDTPDTLDVDIDGLKVVGLPLQFKVNDVQTTANVTAANLNELTGGTATTLHTHAGAGEAERTEYDYTAAEALSKADPVYFTAAGTIGKARADTDSKSWVAGLARLAIPSGAGPVVMSGRAAGVLSSATPGTRYYLGDTGGLSTSPAGAGYRVIFIGIAASADDLIVRIQDMGKKAA